MKSLLLNLHEVVIVLTILETLLLCVVLGILPGTRQQPRYLLQAFFLLLAGTLGATLVTWNAGFQALPIANYVWVPVLLSVCMLLQGPVLFFYLRSLSQEMNFRNWYHGIHLLPVFMVVGVILAYDLSLGDWLPWNWAALPSAEQSAIAFVLAIIKCSPLVYVLTCFYTEYRLRNQWQQMYSVISERELRLANLVLGGFFLHWLWSFIAYFLGGYVSGETNDLLGILNNYLTVLLVNGLFLFGWHNSRELLHASAALEAQTQDPEKDRLQEMPQVDTKLAAVEKGIHQQRLHLESQINLERFAAQVGIKPRELSTIINDHYQQNFFEFINGQRVEEAKRLLASPECAGDTVLDILYKSGFNSQSAFHRFFKRVVGMTPSEYRKSIHQSLVEVINHPAR